MHVVLLSHTSSWRHPSHRRQMETPTTCPPRASLCAKSISASSQTLTVADPLPRGSLTNGEARVHKHVPQPTQVGKTADRHGFTSKCCLLRLRACLSSCVKYRVSTGNGREQCGEYQSQPRPVLGGTSGHSVSSPRPRPTC